MGCMGDYPVTHCCFSCQCISIENERGGDVGSSLAFVGKASASLLSTRPSLLLDKDFFGQALFSLQLAHHNINA